MLGPMTQREAAKVLQVTYAYVGSMRKRGLLSATMQDGRPVYDGAEVYQRAHAGWPGRRGKHCGERAWVGASLRRKTLDVVDRIAEKGGASRSMVLAAAIEFGLDEAAMHFGVPEVAAVSMRDGPSAMGRVP